MGTLDTVSRVLLFIGGLNWGLIGFFNYNLVGAIFGGPATTFSRIIYALVGLSSVWLLARTRRQKGMAKIEKVEPDRTRRAA